MNVINYRNIEELLRSEGEYVTPLSGDSMYPMVRSGKDPVLIVPADKALKRYDVAVYARPGRYVVHRVLECRPDCYVIRGDNCVAKEYVPFDDVIGAVSGFWRGGRFISVTDFRYKVYSRVWVLVNPLVKAHHFIRKCVRFVLKRVGLIK